MAGKSETSTFTITLERPRSGPNQGQYRARLGGRTEPFCGKTALAALSLCASSITATMRERDAAAVTPARKGKARATAGATN